MGEFKPKRAKRYKPNENRNKTFKPKVYQVKQESARQKGYSADWDRYRFRFLHHNPKCYVCAKPSTVVDHRVPWKVDKQKLFWNVHNYLPLCAKCHNFITGKFDRQQQPDIEGKHEWIKARRELNGVAVKVKIVEFKKGSGLEASKG